MSGFIGLYGKRNGLIGNGIVDNATSSALTIDASGNVTIVDGVRNFDIASHDAETGLKLGGTLVTATAARLNAPTALGTVASGTWEATDVAVAHGGTGASTHTANNVLIGAGTSAITSIAPGADGQVLTSTGTVWQSEAAGGGGADLNPGSGEVVINDDQANVDFRVEADARTYGGDPLFVDGSLDQVLMHANGDGSLNTQQSYAYPVSIEPDKDSSFIMGVFNMSTSAAEVMHIGYKNGSMDGNTYRFIMAGDNAAIRFQLYGSGDIATHDGGTLDSDERLKENIVSATSKLDDINLLRVVNYNERTHDSETDNWIHSDEMAAIKRISFIAQEFEQVFPGLVTDRQMSNPGEPEVKRKTIKFTALIPILTKGIQELSDKVDALETANTALEARVTALEG